MNIPFFEYLMISSYVLFIYPKDLAWLLRYMKGRFDKSAVAKTAAET